MAERKAAANRHRGSSLDEFLEEEKLAKARPTRAAAKVEDLDDELMASLKAADFDHLAPTLNKLMRSDGEAGI